MNAKFLPPSVRKNAHQACRPLDDAILARQAPVGGAYPHLVLRIGLVTQAAVSVRRDPDDVLLSPGGGRVSLAGR